jgi:SSS family solute:Na+ symporter
MNVYHPQSKVSPNGPAAQTRIPFFLLLSVFISNLFAPVSRADLSQTFQLVPLAPPPISLERAFKAKLGGTIVIAGGIGADGEASSKVYSLNEDALEWQEIGQLENAWSDGASVANGNELLLIGGRINGQTTVHTLRLILSDENGIATERLADLPQALAHPAAAVNGGTLLVAGGTSDGTDQGATKRFLSLNLSDPKATWDEKESWAGPARHSAHLVKSVETVSLLGGIESNGAPAKSSPSFHPRYGWRDAGPNGLESKISNAVKLGDSHAVVLAQIGTSSAACYLYHTIGDTWIPLGSDLGNLPFDAQLISMGEEFAILAKENAIRITLGEPDTNYGWWDHISVVIYFLVLIYVGFHFSKQSKSSDDFFRGGHKIPWWATGMSLFATGASAMSLMAMPAKSYASNWTFFAISIYFILALPLSMYFLAPLLRKLNYATAFEYLEHRFGLSVRILGSAIFAVGQILGRMGSVLLLPSFALEAIAGIPMEFSVPAMGVVTIAYTYLGGLAAVIWTDTIQGFVMIASVLGCLILVLIKIDMPAPEIWTTLGSQSKLHIFDWGMALNTENVLTVFLGVAALTLLYIGDQNYVQRIQCTRTLADAKKAIATQLGIAVPINVLLFGLGTALFLFYKQQPAELNPAMKNDGIFPFFAAQQLPPGVSGLVIAALLAATMSTISSSICSVSNLVVDDFYKRFSRNPSEAKAVKVGRGAMMIIGLFGIASAFYLNSFETPSIWDLFLRVAGIIAATTLGTFALGLFTRRSNEMGVLAGIATGMAATYLMAKDETIIFWLYPIFGSLVTFIIGYAVSLATGGNQKDLDGLTFANIKNRTGGLDG